MNYIVTLYKAILNLLYSEKVYITVLLDGLFGVSTIPGLWTGLDRGLDSGLDHGLTALRTLINRFHYNITVLLIYTRF